MIPFECIGGIPEHVFGNSHFKWNCVHQILNKCPGLFRDICQFVGLQVVFHSSYLLTPVDQNECIDLDSEYQIQDNCGVRGSPVLPFCGSRSIDDPIWMELQVNHYL